MCALVMTQLTFLCMVWMLLGGSSPGFAGEQPHVFHGIVSQSPPRAADFTLTAHTGKPARLSDFQGKLVLLYFGYTSCPGICPTTLAEVAQALHTLGPQEAEKIQVLMISVDPERDTPTRLAEYVTHFHPSFLGLTGTPEEIATTAASHGIYYRKYAGTAAHSYLVDHTSMVIVVDVKGVVRLLFPFGTPVQPSRATARPCRASRPSSRLAGAAGAEIVTTPAIAQLDGDRTARDRRSRPTRSCPAIRSLPTSLFEILNVLLASRPGSNPVYALHGDGTAGRRLAGRGRGRRRRPAAARPAGTRRGGARRRRRR